MNPRPIKSGAGNRGGFILMPGIFVGKGLLGNRWQFLFRPSFNDVQDERNRNCRRPTEMPAIDSLAGFLDSSATLGMTWLRRIIPLILSLLKDGRNRNCRRPTGANYTGAMAAAMRSPISPVLTGARSPAMSGVRQPAVNACSTDRSTAAAASVKPRE